MNFPDSNFEIKNAEDLLLAIHEETEYLLTTEGDEVECISIENLHGVLTQFFKNVKITQNADC